MKYKRYDKSFEHSYSFGQFPTIELIKSKKAKLISVVCHEKLKENEEVKKILEYCKQNNIEVINSSKQIEIIGGKENCYLVGVFEKYTEKIDDDNHIVLVSPSDSGNLGTIIRTMLGRGITNLAIIENGKKTENKIEMEKSNTSVDIFSPKVIRASMGSIFELKIQIFKNFDDYEKCFGGRKLYAFCLEGSKYLEDIQKLKNEDNSKSKYNEKFSLIFGNESTGLPTEIIEKCEGIKIKQTDKIDSFNLAISVGMAIFEFTK